MDGASSLPHPSPGCQHKLISAALPLRQGTDGTGASHMDEGPDRCAVDEGPELAPGLLLDCHPNLSTQEG